MHNAFCKTFFPLEADVLLNNNSLFITSQAVLFFFFRPINSYFHYQYLLMMLVFQIALSLECNPNFSELLYYFQRSEGSVPHFPSSCPHNTTQENLYTIYPIRHFKIKRKIFLLHQNVSLMSKTSCRGFHQLAESMSQNTARKRNLDAK